MKEHWHCLSSAGSCSKSPVTCNGNGEGVQRSTHQAFGARMTQGETPEAVSNKNSIGQD